MFYRLARKQRNADGSTSVTYIEDDDGSDSMSYADANKMMADYVAREVEIDEKCGGRMWVSKGRAHRGLHYPDRTVRYDVEKW